MMLGTGSFAYTAHRRAARKGINTGASRLNFRPRARAALESRGAPVRRVGAFVRGQGRDACEPAPESRVVDLDRHEARGQLARRGPLERTLEQLDAGKDHHVDGGIAVADDPVGLRQPPLDGARLVGDRVHRRGDLIPGEIRFAAEDRGSDALQARLDIRLVLADDAHDGSGFLGAAAEDRRLRVLQVQVVEDRERLEADVVAVLQHRHAAARVQGEHVRGLVLLLGELQQPAHVRQPLVLEREQHAPREWAATAPEDLDRHRYIRRKWWLDCNDNRRAAKMPVRILRPGSPMPTTLIEPPELAVHLTDPDWAVIDCRFDLARPDFGAQAYAAGHIPHALYAHLERDLTGAAGALTGRHPLPEPARLAAPFRGLGIHVRGQGVAYDQGAAAYAARLWGLLRWLRPRPGAVLHRGLPA